MSTDTSLKEIKPLLLTESEWKEVEILLSILEPFDKYTKRLQAEWCTLSDLYGFWLSLQLKMDQNGNSLAVRIREVMEEYKSSLFDNPITIAAIFLDPRYQRGLTENEKTNAKHFLKCLHNKIEQVEAINLDQNLDENEEANTSFDAAEVEAHLNLICSEHDNQNLNTNETDIEIKINDFVGTRCSGQMHVSEFWDKNKTKMPELFKLASTIYSVSPTQTTVERAFSALAIVLSARRTRIADDNLENILLIRLNLNVYNHILQNIEEYEFIEENEFIAENDLHIQ